MTHEQLLKLIKALGNGENFPKITDDAQVKATVDYLISKGIPWEYMKPEEKNIYLAEVM